MSKKIIVIDPSGHLFPLTLNLDDVEILFLYVDSKRGRDSILSQYPNVNVYYGNEATTWDKTFVSREDIIKYYSIQLKVERFAERFRINSPYAISQYYHALAFWLYQFTTNKIDCILIGGEMEHGSPIDSIPLDLAKSFNIPAFVFENLYAGIDSFKGLRCANSNVFVDIVKLGGESVNFEDVIHPKDLCDDAHVFDFIENAERSEMIKKSVKICVNTYANIVHTWHKLTGNNTCRHRDKTKILDKLYLIYCVLLSFHDSITHNISEVNALSMTVENPNSHIIRNARNLRRLKKYYRKFSRNNISVAENCIIYALHYEPEASIMNRTVYNSQIYNIEMLASVLPNGWKLYVKEHPQQFKSFTLNPSYLKQIPHFRSEWFYEQLLKIKNVELLDDRLSSSSLLETEKYPQIRAFATINGTISAECMYVGKPIILFDVASSVYENIPGFFNITSINDLKHAVEIIASEGYSPNYNDFEKIIPKYLVMETISEGNDAKLRISQKTLSLLIENARDYI